MISCLYLNGKNQILICATGGQVCQKITVYNGRKPQWDDILKTFIRQKKKCFFFVNPQTSLKGTFVKRTLQDRFE